ncbi:MAG: thrombospondin type 3 repeat-containing protein [Nanoarchaeota archaeon]|nr:thrombospondin type 3 repeat-containing protein [Nanoarchaeota archaeon]MBU1004279.1 thrombospondin type 3 repeat-containing protein [Nanoarchaeota archaeon]MBU1946156.1 thrombospondin type 3 repeat-containing protein [Nanoarchaeota archaeon]
MNKLIKSKKAGEGMPWWLILMLIAAVFFVVWWLISSKVISGFSEEVAKKSVEQKLDACKLKYEKSASEGVQLPDKDNDGLPDSCDNCPTVPNSGELVEDKDGDNFPVFKDTKNTICCGNDGIGGDDPKLVEKKYKYCETQDNDKIYGPSKLITSYITPKKS